jgi:3-isopropylmalate/(R)-2-methylmalate dehydratase small subunit
VLNDPDFGAGDPASVKILFAGPDFGTGSSREHAVWALRDYGFDVVISSRFGDIFRGNAGKQGLVAAQVAYEDIERLWEAIEAEPGIAVTVDLVERTVSAGALRVPFDIDDYTRWRLLEGLDDIGLTLRDEESIAAFETQREAWRPKTLPIREPAESGSL